MHPWEDWAESWAHYLHMVDTLETARSFGLDLRPQAVGGRAGGARRDRALEAHTRALDADDFDDLVRAWVPAHHRAQRLEPQHGRSRPLSVRSAGAGGREAAFRPRRDPRAGAGAERASRTDNGKEGGDTNPTGQWQGACSFSALLRPLLQQRPLPRIPGHPGRPLELRPGLLEAPQLEQEVAAGTLGRR